MAIKELKINLEPEVKKLDFYSKRDVLSRDSEGDFRTAFKGKGLEFAGFRKYQPEDDANIIDWKASLRSSNILVREFEEYKNHTIFFLFDVSDSMLFSSHEKLKCEYAAEMIHTLSESLLKSGDNVGMAMFNDTLINKIYPSIGKGVVNNIKKVLLNNENYGGGFSLSRALLLTQSLLGNRAVIIIVSDFIGLEKNWESYVRMCSDSFELIAFMIRDPRDLKLPHIKGRFMLKNPFEKDNVYADISKISVEYEKLNKKHIDYVHSVFRKSRGDFLLLNTDSDYLDEIVKFFNKRTKRG